jgi:hypothetical protein
MAVNGARTAESDLAATSATPNVAERESPAPASLLRGSVLNHRIQIHAGACEGSYRVSGAAEIEATNRPVQDAAAALRSKGAADSDTLMASGPDVPTFIAQTIGKILARRPPPPKSLSALSNGRGPTNP